MTDPAQSPFLRARELFERAVELPHDEREAWLEAECSDQPLLLERVRSLLAADAGTDLGGEAVARAFEAADAAASAVVGDSSGATVGRYRLLRRIATGGMGEVYEAEQSEPIARRVALKLVRPGFNAAPEVAQRFESERQVVSRMSHDGIARIYDAGTAEDGRPFFVMELVDGEPIDRYCDERRLDLDQRLDLFLRVCDAVQHAHRRGVVHRDLKPSNLLVTEQERGTTGARGPGGAVVASVPKVIDFGIAKALEPRAFGLEVPETVMGATLGTPEYMSPEQAGSGQDIDTRTDVYSLGVVLYELLVGSRPIGVAPEGEGPPRAVDLDEARRRIREQPPEPLSRRASRIGADDPLLARRALDADSLRRRLRGDLEWICAKALEKEPERRYGSVDELAADVRRHLEHLPVIAGPPGWGYRLRKLARRHTVAVTIAALVVLGLALGIGGLVLGLRRARAAERQAQIEAERTGRVASFLASTVRDVSARELGDSMVGELRDAVRRAAPAETDEAGAERAAAELDRLLEGVNRPDLARAVLAEQILERAASTAERELGDDPDVQARLLLTVSQAYANLSLLDPAETWVRRAIEVGSEGSEGTLEARTHLGNVLRRQARYDEASSIHREVLAERRATVGDLDPGTLSSLASLGNLEMHRRHPEEAIVYYREAYEGQRTVSGADDPSTLRVLYALGAANVRLGRYQEAEEQLRRALESAKAALGADADLVSTIRAELANLLAETGRLADAEALQREAVSRIAAQLGERDVSTLLQRDVLGWIVATAGRFDEAEAILRELTPVYRELLGEEHQVTAVNRINVAWTMAHQGRAVAAERILRPALRAFTRGSAEGAARTWPAHDIHALVLAKQGRFDESIAISRQILEWRREELDGTMLDGTEPDGKLPEPSARLAGAHYELWLAHTLLDRDAPGDVAEAEGLLERCLATHLEIFGPVRGPLHYRAAAARALLADARFRSTLGDPRDVEEPSAGVAEKRLEARRELDAAIRDLELVHGEGNEAVGDAYLRRGAMAAFLEDAESARSWVEKALAAGAASLALRDHPGFDALSHDPAFRAQVERGLGALELARPGENAVAED